MEARGSLLRSSPLKPRLSIPVSKTLIFTSSGNTDRPDPTQEQLMAPDPQQPGTESEPAPGPSSRDFPSSSQSSVTPQANTADVHKLDADTQTERLQHLKSEKPSTYSADTLNEVALQHPPSKEIISLSDPSESLTLPAPFKPTFTILPQFKVAITHISEVTQAAISVLSSPIDAQSAKGTSPTAFARQEMAELQVTGTWESVEAARVQLLVAIDTLQPDIVSDQLEVDLKLQNMIGGRKRQDLQELMARTRTSIYLASPFVLTRNQRGSPADRQHNNIYITGKVSNVAMAKETLNRAYHRAQSGSMPFTRSVDISTCKLDWMVLNHREKLRSIMIDNASFIAFPPLGGTHPTIYVFGESSVNVERTIRTVMQLSCHFQIGSISLRDVSLCVHIPHAPSFLDNICKMVSKHSGAEVAYRNHGFQMYGNEIQTTVAMKILMEIDFVKSLPYEFKFSVELANEHREFISGKKNGKINRIMKATGARIKFDYCNDYNFYVDLSSTIAAKAMEALVLLQEELPAEISFFVPETYHKRIIGVGGKNIQRIMKKYGVYVKFSNSEEFATLGGYFDNLDNVVARTPSKNAGNLENLKQAVMELVNPKDKDFIRHRLVIPKERHLSLLSDHATVLREIHEATNATILFPERETGSDIVTISGPESLIQQATAMLLSMVEEQFMFPVPYSDAMDRVLASQEFKTEIIDRMKQDWNMTLTPPAIRHMQSLEVEGSNSTSAPSSPSSSGRPASGANEAKELAVTSRDADVNRRDEPSQIASSTNGADGMQTRKTHADYVFIFEYKRNNEDYLQNALELLVQYLARHHVKAKEGNLQIPRLRSDSFGDTFGSLRKRVPLALDTNDLQAQASTEYALFDHAGGAFDSMANNSGAISSGSLATADIRSIFSQSNAPVLPALDTSPARWSDHSRPLSAFQGSPSSPYGANVVVHGQSFGLGSVPAMNKSTSSPTSFNQGSLPADPWAPPSKHQQRASHSSGNYLGPIGELRSASAGSSNVSLSGAYGSGAHGNGSYSPTTYSQLSYGSGHIPDGAYNKAPGFPTSASMTSGFRFSESDSPVHGPSNSIGHFGNLMSHQNSPPHASPQRQHAGASGLGGSMQYQDEKLSRATFGPGYGPSLNSGSGRSSFQQDTPYYKAQQHQSHSQTVHSHQSFSSQPYTSHPSYQQGLQYQQQRQRHSSQNSAASHHTMGLGHIGSGPGSAGGSVNSDEISVEDEGEEFFDNMTRISNNPTMIFPQHKSLQQGYAGGPISGYEGYSSRNSSSSSLLNRRGSAGSTQSVNLQQHLFSQKSMDVSSHLSSGGLDSFGPGSLVGAMEKHSIGHHHQENDLRVGGTRSTPGRMTQGRQSVGMSGHGNNSIPGLSAGSRFEESRGFFSNGFGGIIGDGAHGYGQLNGSTQGSGQQSDSSFGVHGQGVALHQNNSAFGSFGGIGESNGHEGDVRSLTAPPSGLSASALPFYLEPSLHHGQSPNRVNDGSRVVGWDR
ncbi:hypothetical protein BG011_009799 [Mortierella polycephala]|uniref:K Homology domain-containing protein n=1 Tax=Mortierella polycephala TaxID=41804 RepID=A0A9P6TVG0_9FUNG|nr:hypothetical protein BG011_009799 [Mortierella polycephala]